MLQAAAVDGDRLELMLARRVVGEPLEQVLGWAEFCGLRIAVAPGVFVPRRRTEFLVERAVSCWALDDAPGRRRPLLRNRGHRGRDRRTDCEVELHAADIDPDAVACARQNVTMGEVHEGDLYDALPVGLRGRVDLLARERAVRAHRRDQADATRGTPARAPRRPRRGSRRPRRCTVVWRPAPRSGCDPEAPC